MKQGAVVAGLVVCLLASVGFAARLWSWVLNFDPAFAFSHTPAPTGAPLSSGVTLLLVDGLRLDVSRRMPALNALRGRGADIDGRVGTPSFSRPGRATLAVGAPPDVHGVTTNRQRRALSMDNLLRRVGAAGGTCRVSGSTIWPGLFGDDIARCGVFLKGEGKEGPGAFDRQVPEIRAGQENGLDFILREPAALRIADIISTDFAGHEYGGASTEYAAEVARADRYVAEVAGRLDLSTETLVVTADHGHRDEGGHGGEEPEVLAIPIVMVGAGIRPSSTAAASQADIAPTIAALLGVALPAGSSGHPLVSVLVADGAKLDLVNRAAAMQEAAFQQAIAARLGPSIAGEGERDWRSQQHAYRDAGMSGRIPLALSLALVVLAGAAAMVYVAGPGPIGLAVGLLTALLAFIGGMRWLVPALSFSSINYDQMLIPFFARIMVLAALVASASIAAAVLAHGLFHNGHGRGSASALAGGIGLLFSVALVMATMAGWLHHGLLLPLALPGPNRLVESYALTLSTTSAALTTLLAVGLLRALESRPTPRRRQQLGPGFRSRGSDPTKP